MYQKKETQDKFDFKFFTKKQAQAAAGKERGCVMSLKLLEKSNLAYRLTYRPTFWLSSRRINLFLPHTLLIFCLFTEEITAGVEISVGSFSTKKEKTFSVIICRGLINFASFLSLLDKKESKARVMIWITTLCWLLSYQCRFNFFKEICSW